MTTTSAGAATADLRPQVLEHAHRMTRVPILPAACQRLLEIGRMPAEDVDLNELDRLISHDPTMASRILKVANSPHYATRGTVTTVRQAIIVIGLGDLMGLLMAASLMAGFSQKTTITGVSAEEFWIHSVAAGAATRAAGRQWGTDMFTLPEMNLAGLLHDIGKTIFMRHFPNEENRCIEWARTGKCSLLAAEAEVFGITHAELGGVLASEWNLPEFIAQVARHHHAPAQAGEAYVRLARIVAWSDALALAEDIGRSGNVPQAITSPYPGEAEPIEGLLNARRTEVLETVYRDLRLLGVAQEKDDDLDDSTAVARRRTGATPHAVAPPRRKASLWARILDIFFSRP